MRYVTSLWISAASFGVELCYARHPKMISGQVGEFEQKRMAGEKSAWRTRPDTIPQPVSGGPQKKTHTEFLFAQMHITHQTF
jgi:hypothetical protein